MTTVTRRRSNPVADLISWFENANAGDAGSGLSPYVRIEDFVEDDTYVLRAEIPGIDPEKNLEINLDEDVLTIRGERREEHKERNRHEFHYGAFSRSVALPSNARADEATAAYVDGVLEVRVPFDASQEAPRRIPVQRQKS